MILELMIFQFHHSIQKRVVLKVMSCVQPKLEVRGPSKTMELPVEQPQRELAKMVDLVVENITSVI